LAAVRVRQHVNPLSEKFHTPVSAPDWQNIYVNLNLPLHLDIGCARGRFILETAEVEPGWNYLGLEIRQPLVEEANKIRDEKGLKNLHYIFCNANNSLLPILSTLPPGMLHLCSIQFPDPWFKNRHAKRRVVQPKLVNELADYLPIGGTVFLQSDIEFVAIEMSDRFSENPAFKKQHTQQWLADNPFSIATEREKRVMLRGEPVYRAIFERIG
jgi:tRNA (guanine-N7-)-methyltransferase